MGNYEIEGQTFLEYHFFEKMPKLPLHKVESAFSQGGFNFMKPALISVVLTLCTL